MALKITHEDIREGIGCDRSNPAAMAASATASALPSVANCSADPRKALRGI